ncbi:MAG: MATE family efflux transporter [Eubacteriales bacterium]|nr:MATE family efflux transporter [Eubacteriales bacterium]MDD3883039.1 MATE family efflux transporter [Eubacteriales bacterium]MDD4513634.1 MATE family efflux transporter [Eubacteriales bacterium]
MTEAQKKPRERLKDMTEGSPTKLLISFALPLMAGSVFQQMYTLTDTAIIGSFAGLDALASLGAADWFNYLVLSILIGFTQGFSILMSQRFGARDEDGLKKAFSMSILLSAFIAAITLILSEALAAPVLRLLKTPDNIIGGSIAYIRIFFMGIPFVACYNLLAGALRAIGDSKSPLYAMLVSSATNVALDLLFVLGFGWGIKGAAAATVISQALSAAYCAATVIKSKLLKPTRVYFKVDKPLCGMLLRLGLPVAAQNAVIAVGGMAVQRVVNDFGFIFLAGYTATNKLYGLLELAAVSFGHALSVYTGQNIGAGRKDRIRAGLKSATVISITTSAVIGGLMLLLGKPILSLFISAPKEQYDLAMTYAYDFLAIMSVSLPILYMLYVYRSALQGMGDTLAPMLSGIVELVMRVAVAIVLSKIIGYYGTFFAEIAAWIGAMVLQGIALKKRNKALGI